MQAKLDIHRVECCQEWLEKTSESYTASQSIAWLIDQVGILCNSMAFVNNQMAIAKRVLNIKKVKAYQSVVNSVGNEAYFAPSLARDYINALLSKEQYDYDVCERCSRTIFHTLEALRSCLSALKEEAKISAYAGNK